MTTSELTTDSRQAGWAAGLAVPVLAGLAASLALGVYGAVHQPTGTAINVAGFSSPLAVKTWLASVALVFAVVQVVTGLGIFGRLGRWGGGAWVPVLHRWSGRLAVLVTLPVIAQCLYALGFGYDSPRVLVHSITGCLFFGAFVTKMLVLPRRELPGWVVPLLGGLLAAVLVTVWLTSALWFFQTFGLRT